MQEILPQAYFQYSEDEILSITPRLAEKAIIQDARKSEPRQVEMHSSHGFHLKET
jgi:hypothetical protein